jgi:hypothetical protein
MYQVLHLMHQALVNQDATYRNVLAQNKYYVIPVINVDGVNLV